MAMTGRLALGAALTPCRGASAMLPIRASRGMACKAGKGTFFVGGNWKANGTLESVTDLVKGLNAGARRVGVLARLREMRLGGDSAWA